MPSRARRFIPLIITVVLGAPVALLLAWPQAFGLQTSPGVAQYVALRGPLGVLLSVVAVAAAVIALLRRRWAIAAGLAIVMGFAAIAQGVVLLARGLAGESREGELVVLAWNTEDGSASPPDIARLVLDTEADIVSLPETDAEAVAEVARLAAAGGRQMFADTAYGDTGASPIPTSVLISVDLGEYRVDESAGSTPGLPSGVWRPVDGAGPTIVGAHPRPPIPSRLDQWRVGLTWVADQCDQPDVIVAGDLNATIDHMAGLGRAGGVLGECRDAALDSGAAGIGTWPTSLPPLLGTPIDHVLFGANWSARGAEIITSLDDGLSDHRPIVAVLEER